MLSEGKSYGHDDNRHDSGADEDDPGFHPRQDYRHTRFLREVKHHSRRVDLRAMPEMRDLSIPRSSRATRLPPASRCTDACASYNRLIKELGSDSKVVSSKMDYDKVNHLNNVNSFHSMVERWYQDMSGVASKYINRYAALFNLRFQIGKMDPSEALLFVRSRLRGIKTNTFMTIEQLKQEKLYDPPELAWGEGITA